MKDPGRPEEAEGRGAPSDTAPASIPKVGVQNFGAFGEAEWEGRAGIAPASIPKVGVQILAPLGEPGGRSLHRGKKAAQRLSRNKRGHYSIRIRPASEKPEPDRLRPGGRGCRGHIVREPMQKL